mgnify:CR=1 FL=1
MVTLFGLLQQGARGIHAAQAGLNVTGQNLSNAKTEGYSRQRLVQEAASAIALPNGIFGQGVEVVNVERLRDSFIEEQIRGSRSDTSYYEEMESVFRQLETILNDPLASVSDSEIDRTAEGLNDQLSRFFQTINDLSSNPEAPELRNAVVENGVTLSQSFQTVANGLDTLRSDLNGEVSRYVEDINRMTQEVASLNGQIAASEAGGRIASDLRDQRDRILSDLAEFVPITTESGPNGVVHVNLLGERLVDGVNSTALRMESSPDENGFEEIELRVGNNPYTIDDEIRLGELGAILDARDRVVPELKAEIDVLSRGVIQEVNRIHSASIGLQGYEAVESHFTIPEGASAPDTRQTLDSIFNNPRPSVNPDAVREQPFPIQNGAFTLRVTDDEQETIDTYDVNVNTEDSLHDLVERINRSDGIVGEARSALTFEPVFAETARSQAGIAIADQGTTLGALPLTQDYPIGETGGAHSFELHLRNGAGAAIDMDPSTTAIDPIVVNFDDTMTLAELSNEIQTAGNGLVRANVVPSDDDPDVLQLQVEAINDAAGFSIQNDTSGLIEALDFPLTDPSRALVGGAVTRTVSAFSGRPEDSILGTGSPPFSPAFPGPPPNVISEGSFELVVLDSNDVPSVTQITLEDGGVESMDDLAAEIEAADPSLSVTVQNNEFIIESDSNRRFYFQNDNSGLIEAMQLDQVQGHGEMAGEPFTTGSFEIVVADGAGSVSHIVEVPVEADPSRVGGTPSLNDLVDAINQATGAAGAPIQASLEPDPRDPDRYQFQVQAQGNYEFTFRSDDSNVLSALGFTDGPALQATGDNPIEGAEFPTALGDLIGGQVQAEIEDDERVVIRAGRDQEITFMGDSSHFLASAGINTFFHGNEAENMKVNEDLVEDVNLLAVSADGTPGNNEGAVALANLENEPVIGGQTLGEFYRSTISSLGLEGGRVQQFSQTNHSILRELETMQEQNAGVNIDEESINLIQYQQAFQASSRMISTVDQLLDTVINVIGA